MASIRKHGRKWELQYRVRGYRAPFSERFCSEREAHLRKLQVELDAERGVLVPPRASGAFTRSALARARRSLTLGELLERYLGEHGAKNMTPHCFDDTKTRLTRHIVPYLGEIPVVELTAPLLTAHFDALSRQTVCQPGRKPHPLSLLTIAKCRSDLRAALNWGMSRGIIEPGFNAASASELPAREENDGADVEDYVSWDYAELSYALGRCEDETLRFAILMCFACTMRIGELLALDWAHVDVLRDGRRNIHIEYQLQRAKAEYLDRSPKSTASFVFPPQREGAKSVLFLTQPKKASRRYVPYGDVVAEALREHRARQNEQKRQMGADYQDYNLVLAQPNGRPYESKVIGKYLSEFCKREGLPDICTHSLRHTSVDIKLELSGGNIREVMADAGHRTERMTTVQYAAIRNRRRAQTADKIDALLRGDDSLLSGGGQKL